MARGAAHATNHGKGRHDFDTKLTSLQGEATSVARHAEFWASLLSTSRSLEARTRAYLIFLANSLHRQSKREREKIKVVYCINGWAVEWGIEVT